MIRYTKKQIKDREKSLVDMFKLGYMVRDVAKAHDISPYYVHVLLAENKTFQTKYKKQKYYCSQVKKPNGISRKDIDDFSINREAWVYAKFQNNVIKKIMEMPEEQAVKFVRNRKFRQHEWDNYFYMKDKLGYSLGTSLTDTAFNGNVHSRPKVVF